MADTINLGGYPDDGRRVFGTRLEAEITDVVGDVTSASHGFGRAPDGFDAWLECLTAEHDYNVGDRAPLAATNPGTGSSITISFDAEEVHVAATSGTLVLVTRGSSPLHGALTNANWQLVVVPYVTSYV